MTNQRFIGAVGYLLDTITKSGEGQETEVIIKLKFRLPEEENPTLYASTVTEALRRLLDSKELFRKLVKLDKEDLDDNPNSVGYYGYNEKTDNYFKDIDD